MDYTVLESQDEKRSVLVPNAEHLSKHLTYFDIGMIGCRQYICAWERGKVAGLVCIAANSIRVENALAVGYVSVLPEHKNKGIASKMIDMLFQYARAKGKAIANTPYSNEGAQWLKPLMQKTAQRYPDVVLHER